MKKSLLLIPSLVALGATPFIGLTSCKTGGEDKPEPEPKYEDYELDYYQYPQPYWSCAVDLHLNSYYKFIINGCGKMHCGFMFFINNANELDVNVEIIKVVVNGLDVEYESVHTDDAWYCYFWTTNDNNNVEIYLKSHEQRDWLVAHLQNVDIAPMI